ncbi:MAG: acyltransferase family protein [Myxococcales bacterium]|nr:acyltransferase family protein [Myxococcales bacterium]
METNTTRTNGRREHLDPLFLDNLSSTLDELQRLMDAAEPAWGAITGQLGRAVDQLKQFMSTILSVGSVPEIDDFGMEPRFIETVQPLVEFFYRKWFRVRSIGIENVPGEGRGLLVANHSGTLPWDGVMLVEAVRGDHPSHRTVRALVENFIFYFPFLGNIMTRGGAVRACQENAERLLEADELVAVFPEGVKGIGKLYRQRYHLARFGRGGTIRLAIRTKTPIIPVAIIGAEEIMPMLAKSPWLARLVGLPYVPITPTFPWLGPLGLVPLPTQWTMRFGEPMEMAQYGEEALRDRILINRLNEELRQRVQGMLDEELAQRRSVFRG